MNESLEFIEHQGSVHRNVVFSMKHVSGYLSEYADTLHRSLTSVDTSELEKLTKVLFKIVETNKTVFVCGNGGSSSIADHLCCDFSKGSHSRNARPLKTQSLSANTALYSACANDFGFDNVFSKQLDLLGGPGDLLIAISSSGKSENIIRAVTSAKAKDMVTVGLTGFNGGQLKEICDISLHVAVHNYGVVEDSHQALMHVIAQYFGGLRQKL